MFTTIVVTVLSAAQPSVPTTIPAMWTDWCARWNAADGSGKVAEPTITVEPLDFSDCRTERHEQGTSLFGSLRWEYREPIRARP